MGQIRVTDPQKEELDKLKDHPRDTYEDVMDKVLKAHRNETYDLEFKEWVKDTIGEHLPDVTVLHVTECSFGLQVFIDESNQNNILIPNDELKIWKVLYDEGMEPSAKSYTLIDMSVLQSINQKIR